MSPEDGATPDKLTAVSHEGGKGIVQAGTTEGPRASTAEEMFEEEKKESLLRNQDQEENYWGCKFH